MKNFLIVFFLTCTNLVNATNYYVNATSGNDGLAGTSTSNAWATVSKVSSMMSSMSAGDSILFKRGQVFDMSATLTFTRSTIIIDAYGDGDRPLFTSKQTLSSWTSAGSGIYYATVSTSLDHLEMVTINGRPFAMGRYPNDDAGNGGWLTYESYSGNTSITDAQLTTSTNWTGADVVIRKKQWISERLKITNHASGTLTYNKGVYFSIGNYTNYTPGNSQSGYGYFIQNDLRTLDKNGEWFFDSTNQRFYMHFGGAAPNTNVVEVATEYNLFNIDSRNNIHINNVDFAYTNHSAIYATVTSNIHVTNSNINYVGGYGVQLFQTGSSDVDNVNVTWAHKGGVCLYSGTSYSDLSITNCKVLNIGKFYGHCAIVDATGMIGLYASALSGITISDSQIDSTGRDGIKFGGSDALVEYNNVGYFDYLLDDQGGIYTYQGGTDADPGVVSTNTIIRNNWVHDGLGNIFGRTGVRIQSTGIYLDGRKQDVRVENNLIERCTNNGIHTNNPGDVYIKNNVVVNCERGITFMRWYWGSISNLNIKKNVVFSQPGQIKMYYTESMLYPRSLATAISSVGVIDSNYYNFTTALQWQIEKYDSCNASGTYGYGLTKYDLTYWKNISGQDGATIVLPDTSNIFSFQNVTRLPVIVPIPFAIRTKEGNILSTNQLLQPGEILFGTHAQTTVTKYLLLKASLKTY